MAEFVAYVREMGRRVAYWLDEELDLSLEGRLRAIREDWMELKLPG